jgi:hypothetical protein
MVWCIRNSFLLAPPSTLSAPSEHCEN